MSDTSSLRLHPFRFITYSTSLSISSRGKAGMQEKYTEEKKQNERYHVYIICGRGLLAHGGTTRARVWRAVDVHEARTFGRGPRTCRLGVPLIEVELLRAPLHKPGTRLDRACALRRRPPALPKGLPVLVRIGLQLVDLNATESGFLVFWLRIATRSLGVCHGDDSVPAKFLVHVETRSAAPLAWLSRRHKLPYATLSRRPDQGQFEQARLGTNRTVPSSETDVVESASCDVVNQSPARASDTGPTEPDTESPQPSDVEQRRQRSASSIQRRLSSLRMPLPQVVGPDRTILPVPRDCGLRSESKFHREKELPSTQIEDDSSLVLGRHASNADSLARLNFHGRKDQQGQPENQTQHGQQMQMQTHLTVLPCPKAMPPRPPFEILKKGLTALKNSVEKTKRWLGGPSQQKGEDFGCGLAADNNDANRVEEDSWLETASDYERGFAHLDTKEMGLKKLKRFAVEVVKIYANTTSKKRKRVHQGSWVITAMTVHSSSDERLLAGPAPGHFLEGYDVGSRSCTAISETAE
ncbi:hypothetical protein B0H13DRAFT_1853773 [Mycena leptocephala]|nr:hypothetical protein B0H13DRAFT_1853773 [Mycena leptocephala]